ncbi:YutD family protein [Paenibacillus wynnii]|uniref:YutD family protein n=1 Tax=Paenibacillus wynnii TaxID=268407 RepID=UPI00278E73A2|nr:YutD family protein [Paenibacillus wynnii]MDQ0193848.1 uncharacterized protein YutD [Paenibacillus wynnii]
MIVIGGKGYELMLDHKDGWNPEAFRGRYSEVLERYDYIIGDWGYSQLRLKGFYRDNHPKVNRDTAISGMVDYINEYCNFGCAHFVLRKLKEQPVEGYKDILTKEPQEYLPAEDMGTELPLSEDAAKEEQFKALTIKQSSSSSKDGGSKDRPVREHQGKKHRAKEAHGKKNPPRENQGRPSQVQPLDQQQ